jgi:hypothetical protein
VKYAIKNYLLKNQLKDIKKYTTLAGRGINVRCAKVLFFK